MSRTENSRMKKVLMSECNGNEYNRGFSPIELIQFELKKVCNDQYIVQSEYILCKFLMKY